MTVYDKTHASAKHNVETSTLPTAPWKQVTYKKKSRQIRISENYSLNDAG